MVDQVPPPAGKEGARLADDDSYSRELSALRVELTASRGQVAELEHERSLAAEREQQLRDELQHQVRNMLAIIRSISSRTAALGQSMEDASDHFRGRLDALSRFQSSRAASPHGANYLEDLVRDELQSFEFDDRIEIEGDELAVPHDVAQVLGLALHELATNSIKFGALSRTDDRTSVKIRWVSRDGALVLTWQESGVAVLSAVPVRRGFGREFIEDALPYQLGATTVFEMKPGGLSCSISIPLGAERAAEANPRNWF
jgi:two-component sensor histidine kinase